MKKTIIAVALCAGLISTLAMARGGHHNDQGKQSGYNNYEKGHSGYHNSQGQYGGYNNNNQNSTYIDNIIENTPIAELTDQQKDDLVFMYQEEKVARDVYKTLGDIWGAKVFLNIQKAEQRHMDVIKSLLEKYSLPIPVVEDTVGVFENEALQSFYDQSIEQGKTSLQEALNIGLSIEETDIADLENKITDTPEDIKAVFERLLNGSNHHLKAFSRVIEYNSTGK